MPVTVVVGLQRGDEGKGRFVDLIAPEYQIVARGNGGANAGHSIVPEGMEPFVAHQIPSGIAYSDKINVIGSGVYLDPVRLKKEIEDARLVGLSVKKSNLLVSDTAHLVMPHHILYDTLREGTAKAQGSTKAGIAFVASDKYRRIGIRAEDMEHLSLKARQDIALEALLGMQVNSGKTKNELLALSKEWAQAIEFIKEFLTDTGAFMRERLKAGDNILAEGAQAFWLDINHGMYPYVTSSSTTVNGLLDGLGIPSTELNRAIGVAKMVKSHVGDGPFVTEITDQKIAGKVRGERGNVDSEYGSTTKRERRIGYPDLVEINTAVQVNGISEICLTKADHLSRYGKELQIADAYSFQGKKIVTAPSSAHKISQCKPIYTKMPTSNEDISDIRNFKDLPIETKNIVKLYEEFLGKPVTKIGVGPGRNQVICKK